MSKKRFLKFLHFTPVFETFFSFFVFFLVFFRFSSPRLPPHFLFIDKRRPYLLKFSKMLARGVTVHGQTEGNSTSDLSTRTSARQTNQRGSRAFVRETGKNERHNENNRAATHNHRPKRATNRPRGAVTTDAVRQPTDRAPIVIKDRHQTPAFPI